MSDELRAADLEAVRQQLGREPTTPFSVVARCTGGHPLVIRNRPLDADGNPFPTIYWLTCPDAVEPYLALESEGWIASRLGDDPAFARVRRGGASRLRDGARRDAPGAEEWGGVGGTRRGIKCLHAHYAYHLAGGDDVVGRWTAERVEPVHPEEPGGRSRRSTRARTRPGSWCSSREDPATTRWRSRATCASRVSERRGRHRPARPRIDRASRWMPSAASRVARGRCMRSVSGSGRPAPSATPSNRNEFLDRGPGPDRRRARGDRRRARGCALVPRRHPRSRPATRAVPAGRHRGRFDRVRVRTPTHGRRTRDLHADGERPAHRTGPALRPAVTRPTSQRSTR